MSERVLYKYLDAKGGLMMLYYSNLMFTNATQLNDPFDCHPALFDYSNAPEMESGWPSPDFISSMEEKFNENQRYNTWICSLSEVHDSLLMWSYYNKHQGICVGIDIEKAKPYLDCIYGSILGCMELKVQYKNIVEKPDYFHDQKDLFKYQLATKAREWEHEQEYRLLKKCSIVTISPAVREASVRVRARVSKMDNSMEDINRVNVSFAEPKK